MDMVRFQEMRHHQYRGFTSQANADKPLFAIGGAIIFPADDKAVENQCGIRKIYNIIFNVLLPYAGGVRRCCRR
jgi:hypothetical protein